MCGVPVAPRRRIPAPPDRARPPRRGLRAARRPGRGAEARRQERGAARRGAPRHARHADRGHAARRRAATITSLAIARDARRRADEPFALAWIDISTGEFRLAERDRAGLAAEIARLEPGEIIVSDALYGDRRACALSALAAGGDAARAATCSTARPPSGGSPTTSRSPPRDALRRACRGSSSPPPRPASPMWSAPSSASARRSSPPAREAAGATLADRRRDARQSRAHPHARGRAARLAARRHRPHRDGRRARGCWRSGSPPRSPIRRAIARRLDAVAAFRRRRELRAPTCARALDGRARSRPRARAARGRPRRPARPRRHPRRHRRGRRARRRLERRPGDRRRASRRPAAALRPPDPALADELAARARRRAAAAQARRRLRARRATTPRSTRRAALRDESRRVIAALQARYAEATGVRALKIRHNNVLGYFVEVTAQHGDKLLGAAAQRDLHPPPDARRPGALHHHRAGRARSRRSPAPPTARSALELEIFERSPRTVTGGGRRHQGGGRGARRPSTSPRRWPQLAVERDYVRPEVDASLDFVIDGRPPSGGRAGARARRRAVRRQRLRSVAARVGARPAASGCSPARTWPASRPSCARTR